MGLCDFELRGTTISSAAQPYSFYLLQCVQDAYTELERSVCADVDILLSKRCMTPILGASLDRRVGMRGNMEVWL